MEEEVNEQVMLAQKRTELAHERTILAYFRTSASLILFGLAFLGFQEQYAYFLHTGVAAIGFGFFLLIVAVYRLSKHHYQIKATVKAVGSIIPRRKK